MVPTQSIVGQKIAGYLVLEKIGSGGMANVFKAYDAKNDRDVAIKLIHPFLLEDRLMVRRFEQEAKVLASLSHPNIVGTYAYEQDEAGNHLLLMEYINGRSLKAFLHNKKFTPPIPLEETIRIIVQVASAIGHAHQHKIIHRDIKPSNVMVTADNRAVLMDFGIVKLLDQTSAMTITGSLLGTPAYMSPEQALGEPGDTRGDIYALGVLLYQMVTGQLPFDADTPMGIIMKHVSERPPLPALFNPNTPLSLHHVIMKALEKDPADRYQTAEELIEALQQVDLSGNDQKAPVEYEVKSSTPAQLDTISSPPISAPFQFPPQIPNFSERAKTLQRVIKKLSDGSESQIVGLVGFGGVGKTAVAVHAVRQLTHKFPDGILWAQLDYSTPEAELVKIADAFGQAEAVSQKFTLPQKADFVRQILANKNVLIVLDNAQDSEQIKWLIPTGKQNATLITSRNQKMLRSLDAHVITVTPFNESEAVQFLATVIGAERVLNERSTAKELGQLVGGLPLALSIVASLLNEATDLSIAEYTDLLRDEKTRLANLTDWEDATRDVAASFELSFQSLPVPLQHLFASLAIFDGPDFAARDVSIISKIPPVQAKMGLGRLHSLSLIGTGLGERESALPIQLADDGRYQINPLLRAFAREKLGETYTDLRHRSAEYFANMAHLNTSFEDNSRLDLEWQNIYGAMAWSFENKVWPPLQMGTLALTAHHFGNFGFMDARGLWAQASTLLNWCLQNPNINQLIQSKLLNRLAAFAIKQHKPEEAEKYLQTNQTLLKKNSTFLDFALEKAHMYSLNHHLAQQNNQQEALAWINKSLDTLAGFADTQALQEKAHFLILKSAVLVRLGMLDEAEEASQIGMNLLPTTPTPSLIGAYLNLTSIYYYQGKFEQCAHLLEEVMPIAEKLGDFTRLARAAMNLGIMQEQLGDFQKAARNYKKSLRLQKALGNSDDEGSAHINLASLYNKLGEEQKAIEHAQKAAQLAAQFNLLELKLFSFVAQAEVYLNQDNWLNAQSLIQPLFHEEELKEAIPPYLLPSIYRIEAKILWLRGDLELALERAKVALDFASDDSYRLEQGICWRVIGRIKGTLSAPDTVEALEQSIEILSDQSPYELAKSQLILAQFLVGAERFDEAMPLLYSAKERFEHFQAKRELKFVLDILGSVQ